MPLDQEQIAHTKLIAKDEVREYFDHYQTDIFPTQLKIIISAHNTDDDAHGGVEKKVTRFIWMAMGVAIASGGTGAFVAKAMGAFGG